MPRRPSTGDHGETLIEILVAVFVLGLTGIAILGLLQFTISGSTRHRDEAAALTIAASAAEQIKNNGFQPCGGGPSTATLSFTNTVYLVQSTGPKDLNSSSCPSGGSKLERYTITITKIAGGQQLLSLDVVLRNTT